MAPITAPLMPLCEAILAPGAGMLDGKFRSAPRVSQHVLLLLAEAGDAKAQRVARF